MKKRILYFLGVLVLSGAVIWLLPELLNKERDNRDLLPTLNEFYDSETATPQAPQTVNPEPEQGKLTPGRMMKEFTKELKKNKFVVHELNEGTNRASFWFDHPHIGGDFHLSCQLKDTELILKGKVPYDPTEFEGKKPREFSVYTSYVYDLEEKVLVMMLKALEGESPSFDEAKSTLADVFFKPRDIELTQGDTTVSISANNTGDMGSIEITLRKAL